MSDSPGAGLPRAIDLSQRTDGGWVLRLEWRETVEFTRFPAGQTIPVNEVKEHASYRTIECDAKTAENLRTLLAPIVRVR